MCNTSDSFQPTCFFDQCTWFVAMTCKLVSLKINYSCLKRKRVMIISAGFPPNNATEKLRGSNGVCLLLLQGPISFSHLLSCCIFHHFHSHGLVICSVSSFSGFHMLWQKSMICLSPLFASPNNFSQVEEEFKKEHQALVSLQQESLRYGIFWY